jgi:hypothetical protein
MDGGWQSDERAEAASSFQCASVPRSACVLQAALLVFEQLDIGHGLILKMDNSCRYDYQV